MTDITNDPLDDAAQSIALDLWEYVNRSDTAADKQIALITAISSNDMADEVRELCVQVGAL